MDITYYFIFKWDLPSLIKMTSAEKIEFRKVSTKGIPILSQSLSSHPARCIPTVGFEDIVVVTPGWAKPGQAGREAIIIETRARWCYTRRRFNSSVNQFCPISLSPSLSRYSLCAFLCRKNRVSNLLLAGHIGRTVTWATKSCLLQVCPVLVRVLVVDRTLE